jgi:hypothetical protein
VETDFHCPQHPLPDDWGDTNWNRDVARYEGIRLHFYQRLFLCLTLHSPWDLRRAVIARRDIWHSWNVVPRAHLGKLL